MRACIEQGHHIASRNIIVEHVEEGMARRAERISLLEWLMRALHSFRPIAVRAVKVLPVTTSYRAGARSEFPEQCFEKSNCALVAAMVRGHAYGGLLTAAMVIGCTVLRHIALCPLRARADAGR